jgi:hypothetical protein
MLLAAIGIMVVQQVPGQAVTMSATLGGKPYGTVYYIRQLVPGRAVERTVRLEISEEDSKYTVAEKRVYTLAGVPTSTERTYIEGERRISVSVSYDGPKATVTYKEGDDTETDEMTLAEEGATLTDPTQAWFLSAPPAAKASATFWEFSLDENSWVVRKVKYEGVASLKIGEKTVQAHRISIGDNVNWYVDDKGMPYKSVQKTADGELVLLRTSPEVGP